MLTAVLAALLTAVSGWLLLRPVPGPPRRPSERADRGTRWTLVLAGAGPAALGWLVWGLVPFRTFVLITIVCGAAVGVFGILRRRRAARRADRRADHVLGCCVGMAGDLAAGQPPITVLERAAADWPELAPVAVAGRVGADVPTAFRELARRPGAGSLRTVAASWQVAEETGAGLAAALHRAADSIRAERRTARLVAAELAAARATARMLAVLPVGVLLMGAGIGGDPVGFLLHHPLGLACLGTGAALSLLGLRWLEVIADRVLR